MEKVAESRGRRVRRFQQPADPSAAALPSPARGARRGVDGDRSAGGRLADPLADAPAGGAER